MAAQSGAKTPESHTPTCTFIREKLGFTIPSSSNAKQDYILEKKSQRLIIPKWKTMMQIQQDAKKTNLITGSPSKGLLFEQNITNQQIHQKEQKPVSQQSTSLKSGKESSLCAKQQYAQNNEKQAKQYNNLIPVVIQIPQYVDRFSQRTLKNSKKASCKKPKILVTQQATIISGNKKVVPSDGLKVVTSTPKANKPNTIVHAINSPKENQSSEKSMKKKFLKQGNLATTTKGDSSLATSKRKIFPSVPKSPQISEVTTTDKPTVLTTTSSHDTRLKIIAKLKTTDLDDNTVTPNDLSDSINFCRHGIFICPPPEQNTRSYTNVSAQTVNTEPDIHYQMNKTNLYQSAQCEENVTAFPNQPGNANNKKLSDLQSSQNNEYLSPVLSPHSKYVNPTYTRTHIIIPTKYKTDSRNIKGLKKSRDTSHNRSNNSKTSTEINQSMKVKFSNSVGSYTKSKSTLSNSVDGSDKSTRFSEKNLNGKKDGNFRQGKSEANFVRSTTPSLRNIRENPIKSGNSKTLKPVVRKHSSISFRSSKHILHYMKRAKSNNQVAASKPTIQTQTSRPALTHSHNVPLCCHIWGHEDNLTKRVASRTSGSRIKCHTKNTHVPTARKRNSCLSTFYKRKRKAPKVSSSRSIFKKKSSRLLTRISHPSLVACRAPLQQPQVLIRGQDPPYAVRRQMASGVGGVAAFPKFVPHHTAPRRSEWTLPKSIIKQFGRHLDRIRIPESTITSQPNAAAYGVQKSANKNTKSIVHIDPSPGSLERVEFSSGTLPSSGLSKHPMISRSSYPITTDAATSTSATTPPRNECVDIATGTLSAKDLFRINQAKALIRELIFSPSLFTLPSVPVTDTSTAVADSSDGVAKVSGEVPYKSDAVHNIPNESAAVCNITNESTAVNNIPNNSAADCNIPNKSGSVCNITNESEAVSNIPEESSAVSNIANKSTAVNTIPNESTAVSNIPNKSTRVSNIPNKSSAISNISKKSAAITNISNKSAAISNISNKSAAISNISNNSAGISNISNKSAAISNISNNSAAISNISNKSNTNIPNKSATTRNIHNKSAVVRNNPKQSATVSKIVNKSAAVRKIPTVVADIPTTTNNAITTINNTPTAIDKTPMSIINTAVAIPNAPFIVKKLANDTHKVRVAVPKKLITFSKFSVAKSRIKTNITPLVIPQPSEVSHFKSRPHVTRESTVDSSVSYLVGRETCTSGTMTLNRVQGTTDMRTMTENHFPPGIYINRSQHP